MNQDGGGLFLVTVLQTGRLKYLRNLEQGHRYTVTCGGLGHVLATWSGCGLATYGCSSQDTEIFFMEAEKSLTNERWFEIETVRVRG
jgi:hypothetical protein